MRKKKTNNKVQGWLKHTWDQLKHGKTWGFIGLGAFGALMLVQLGYPLDRIAPFAEVEGVTVGGMRVSAATQTLDEVYRQTLVNIYFGDADEAHASPTLGELGVHAYNEPRMHAQTYGWWRIVPTSIFWAHAVGGEGEPQLTHEVEGYARDTLGDNCRVEPRDAALTAGETGVEVVPALDGGRCEIDDVIATLSALEPRLEQNDVRLDIEVIAPEVSDEDAEMAALRINERLHVRVHVNDDMVEFVAQEVLAWLEFDGLELEVHADEMLGERLNPHVRREPGVTRVVTRDFAEISRDEGHSGQALDVGATEMRIAAYLVGDTEGLTAATRVVEPRVEYERQYSPTDRGLNALARNFAEDNDGVYGISFVELSGQRRRAEHDGDRQFVSASTYKVYAAYSTLKRVERGEYRWGQEIVNGKNLEQCFEEMLALSDNPCSERLVEMIGYGALHAEAREAGARNTTFIDEESFRTTAADLSEFLARLETDQLDINSSSRERLLGALGRNIYRDGIPAGSKGTVLNKVGFLDDYLHDAAIVRGGDGTYVLSIMTEDASWGLIAEFTRQMERLRVQ